MYAVHLLVTPAGAGIAAVGVVVCGLVAAAVAVGLAARRLSARRRRARLLRRLDAVTVPRVRGGVAGLDRGALVSLDCTRGDDYYREQRDRFVRRLAERGLTVDELRIEER